jgi:WD40 repeat protein
MRDDEELKQCPTCGTDVFADLVDGLCLKCLGKLGFYSEPAELNSDAKLRLGDYELLEEIARGGMGVVYRARQLSLNRIVAVKVLLHGPFSSPDFIRRFRNEAHAAASLRHPNIVAVYEIGEQGGSHFLSMEFVEGGSLAGRAAEKPLPPRRAAEYLKTIACAVEHAHQHGVFHRDLKPSNILLDTSGQPRVTDFGLAKLMNGDAELTITGQVLGSPNYMAPEQAAGKNSDRTAQADIYSLGAILYDLLTGRPPFEGETLPYLLARVQNDEPIPPRRLNPDVPLDLQTICLKCLEKEPARRYASARELAEDLERVLLGEPICARPVSDAERLLLWCRRRPVLAALSGALFVTLLLGGAGILWQWRLAEFHARGEQQQRLLAEKQAQEMRLNLYAADMEVASKAAQDGNYGLVRSTLNGWRPAQGETDLRGFEWRYLAQECKGDQLAVLAGHTGTVTCAAFSPNGDLLATGSYDGSVKIWESATRTLRTTLNVSQHAVSSVAFTSDGGDLIIGCSDRVEIRHVDSWKPWRTFPGGIAAVSQTGTFLATAESSPFFWEPAGEVKLWDWRTGHMLRRLNQKGRALAFSKDGRLLSVADPDRGVCVWDTITGALAHQWVCTNSIWSMDFSPDGRRLLCTDWSSEVSIWKLEDQSPSQKLSGHQMHVWDAIYSPDGSIIATASSDQTVRLWGAADLRPIAVLHGHSSEVWSVAFRSDGKMLASGGKDQNVMLWKPETSSSPKKVPHDMDFRPIFSPDGHWLVTVDPNTLKSVLWNANDASIVSSNLAANRSTIGFSRDSKYVVSFHFDPLRLRYWSPNSAAFEKEVALQGVMKSTLPFVFGGMSPNREFFLAVDAMGLIHVWDTDTGNLVRSIQGPPPRIRNAVLSLGGKAIALCAESENIVHLYHCGTGAELRLAGHRDFISGLAFSPDGQTLATSSMDGTIRLWDTENGGILGSLPGHMQEATDVAFSPDGRTLASLGRGESLKFWHVPTLREMASFNEPHAGMWITFSPDGEKLAVETDKDTLELLAAPFH